MSAPAWRAVWAAVFLAWPAVCAAGSVRHVAPGGSDRGGDGSVERPWKTLAHATAAIADDGATIVLRDGLYEEEQVVRRAFAKTCTIRAAHPYRARLRSPAGRNRVLSCYGAANVRFVGLEMCGSGGKAGEYLIHVGTSGTRHIAFEDCIIHDGYNNDLVKVNDRVSHVAFRGCVFFNQTDHEGDQLLDINTVTDVSVEDSILFADYGASGRTSLHRGQGFVVAKNSGRAANYTRRIALRRNVFLGWDGRPDQAFVLLGEDGQPFYEAQEVLIENNLFLHHTPIRSWGTVVFKGGLNEITFRANTVVGHPVIRWSGAYAVVCQRIERNPPMGRVVFANNIWSDPGGYMPRFSIGDATHFAPGGEPTVRNNLYWNGGKAIPALTGDLLSPARDPKRLTADPGLADPAAGVVLPRWDAAAGRFCSGRATIREEFVRLVRAHGAIAAGSPAAGAADPRAMPAEDILGRPRGSKPAVGCFQPP